eukprot:PhM_4_TR2239/c0_g1_i3/m.82571/K01745/hutH, HAL; histidine ammonia-lyase
MAVLLSVCEADAVDVNDDVTVPVRDSVCTSDFVALDVKPDAEATNDCVNDKDIVGVRVAVFEDVSVDVSVANCVTLSNERDCVNVRINTLAKGHSGIRVVTLQRAIDLFNAGFVPFVPIKGTVGASGDLAPLAHVALGLIGEGLARTVSDPTPRSAKDVMKELRLPPIDLEAKEGLALINGTQLITSIGCEAVVRGHNVARQADIIAAVTLEALKGTTRAFDPAIHNARPHLGQNIVAMRMRHLLNNSVYKSEIAASHKHCNAVQDAYSLRCIPQVHGVVNDAIGFVHGLLTIECNSATDNPMIFPDLKESKCIVSGGNFHGEYPAKAMDFFAIAVHELGSIAERRIERLCNPSSSNLPAFLVKDGGLNSGYMMVHCTAAALVSENKVLCHPASIDSQSLSAAKEDHVSMGGFAARKAIKVVDHVETVCAIELLCAVQALEFHRPLKTTEALEKVVALVRSLVPRVEDDRYFASDIEAVKKLVRECKVWECVKDYIPHQGHHPHPPTFMSSKL